MIKASLFAALLLVAAAPPPPIVTPPELAEPVDGYDLRGVYQRWRYWVEQNKGVAADNLLARAEVIEGEEVFGAPLLRFKTIDYDFGHIQSGEISTFCRPSAKSWLPEPGSCHHRFRRVSVPHDAAGHSGSEDNPVARWTKETFDPAALTRHFRESGILPDGDWTRDKDRMFSGLPSPVPMLMQNATVLTVDSRDCPSMAEAIEAVEESPPLRLDLQNVGDDAERYILSPHSIWNVYTVHISLPGRGGHATVEGSGPALDRLFRHVINAATYCDKQAKRQLQSSAR